MKKTADEFLHYAMDYSLVKMSECIIFNRELEKNLWLELAKSIEKIEQFQASQEANNENSR
jgi:Uri superfamily endonuclease